MPIIAKQIERDEAAERLHRLRHSAAHLMAEAVQDLFPGTRLAFGPAIEDGFYYDFESEHRFTEEDLPRIEARMHELAKADAPFVREEINQEAALALFDGQGEHLKAEHVATLPEGGITIYRSGRFVDLCAGRTSSGRAKSSTSNCSASPAATGAATSTASACSASTAPPGRASRNWRTTLSAWRAPSCATTASWARSSGCSSSRAGRSRPAVLPAQGRDHPAGTEELDVGPARPRRLRPSGQVLRAALHPAHPAH